MWARIEKSKIVELTDSDPHGRYRPDMLWVDCPPTSQIGDAISLGAEYEAAELARVRLAKIAEIDAAYTAAIGVISASYPETERNSWARQEAEARVWAADATAATPLLSAIAAARGTTLADICARVIANADAYAVYAGGVIGKRQAKMIAIAAATTISDLEAVTW